jgi:diguanylate cyclase (GGDEF)-like protein/PAS domain S-box-containing protein
MRRRPGITASLEAIVAGTVLASMTEGVVIADRTGTIVWTNTAFCRLMGHGDGALVGKHMRIFAAPGGNRCIARMMTESSGTWSGEVYGRRKDGEIVPQWLSVASLACGYAARNLRVGIVSDLSAGKRLEARIHSLTYVDDVTALPNGAAFRDRLDQAMSDARHAQCHLVLILVSLDRFTSINETLGFRAGDALLRDVGRRLLAIWSDRHGDVVSRIRGDTFACLVPGSIEGFADDVDRLFECFAVPYEIGDTELFVTASIGVAGFPVDALEPGTLVRCCDAAMAAAKRVPATSCTRYTRDMATGSALRMRLETEMRKALRTGTEFLLHYQPKVCARSGRTLGAEGLIRWRHDRELLVPGHFMQVAEDTGLVTRLDEIALRRACAQLITWQATGLVPVPVAINLSAQHFRQPGIERRIAAIVAESSLSPDLLELELTENAIMTDADAAISSLSFLRDQGFAIAIDDFGTGFSSLSYLAKLPVTRVKIDRSFMGEVRDGSPNIKIIGSIISLAHSLRMRVTAEGVETEAQVGRLRQMGCDELQGYYFGKPMPAHHFTTILAIDPVADDLRADAEV